MSRIAGVIQNTRQCGNTHWILKSAIYNPKVIIVCADEDHAMLLKKEYSKLLTKVNWFTRMRWKIFGREHPMFKSISSRFEGLRLPVVFDNYSILHGLQDYKKRVN